MADYYQLLGVTPQASAGEIRQAYAKLARDKHPDRFTDPAAKQQAQRAFQDLTTAFNALTNPKSRQEYDQARDKPVPKTPEEIATDAYERSQAALEGGQLQEAVTLLYTAVHHAPTQVSYQLALGRALGKAAGHDAAREAVQVLERVTQMAELLLKQGLKLRARRAAEMALRLNPQDRAARAVMEATAQ